LRPVLPPATSRKPVMLVTLLPLSNKPEARNASVRNLAPPLRNVTGSAGNVMPDWSPVTHR
jgi:hypothetical protein